MSQPPRPSPADIGRRISLRRLLTEAPGQGDVVGRLLAWTPEELWLRRNDASVIAVRHADVVAGRVVPEHPRPGHVREPAMSPADLQVVADAGWPAAERDECEGWVLRAHHGVTRRANSVLAPGPLPVDLDRALDRAVRWYAERDLPLLVQTPSASATDLGLVARGWSRAEPTVMRTAPLRLSLETWPARPEGLSVARSSQPDPDWYAVDGDPDPRRRSILTGPADVVFVTVRGPDGGPWGVGRASAVAGWLGVTSLATVPAAQRRGVALAVMRELAVWGVEVGAEQAYLQVRTVSSPARRLYDRLGFQAHHLYAYLSPPGAAVSQSA